MSPVSRGRTSKKQKKAQQKSRQRSAGAAVQREDTQFADLLPAGSQPGQPSSGFRALSALVDQLAGPRERPAWFGPSIGRMLRQQAPVIAATGPRELEQAVTELAGAEVYWALNEAKRGLWFEWWFEELVQAAAGRVKAEAAGEGGGWQAPWRLLHGLAAIGSPALRSAALQAVKDVGRALTRQQLSAAPDWLGLCPAGSVTGGIWAMRDDYRTRFAILAECGYPGGVDPHVFLLDIDACVTVTPADAAVFDSLDQAVAAWREGKDDTARTALPEPVTDYSQLGFLVRCDASPNGPFRGDESRGYADNLFRVSRRIHDIADAMAGRGHQWPDESGSHRDHAARAEAMAKAFGDWYARRHGREPGGEAVRWLAGDWVTGERCRDTRTRSRRTASGPCLPTWTTTGCRRSQLRPPRTSCCRNGSGGVASKPASPDLSSSGRLRSRSAANWIPATALRSASSRDQVARRSTPGAIQPNGPCWRGLARSLERCVSADEARRMICCHQALALEHGLTVVSTDTDFVKYPGVTWLNPVSPRPHDDFTIAALA